MHSVSNSPVQRSLIGVRWDRSEIASALSFLDGGQTEFLHFASHLINSYQGWTRSSSYYDFICGEWLLAFRHVVYAHYIDVMRNGNFPVSDAPLIAPVKHHEFITASATSIAFHEGLRAVVQHLLDSQHGIQSRSGPETRVVHLGYSGPWARIRQFGRYALSQGVSASPDAPVLLCEPHVKIPRTEWLHTLRRWRRWAREYDFSPPISVTIDIDHQWRGDYSQTISVNSFQELTYALLPLYIPCVYLEGLKRIRHQAHDLKVVRPKIAYTANAFHGNLMFKLAAADWREDGTKIHGHQHGGGYGLSLRESVEEYEIRVSDHYYSYGWIVGGDKVSPLTPAISLASVGRNHNRRNLLLVLNAVPPYVYRIQFGPMPGMIDDAVNETREFVRNVHSTSITVRPHSTDYGLNLAARLMSANPAVSIDSRRMSIFDSCLRHSLVVHSYLGTPWLETLAMNIPTICFFVEESNAFREDARPFVESLYQVGVLHNTGKSAASFIEQMGGNVSGWWQSSEVQSAREAFIERYAKFSYDWENQWELALRSAADSI